MTRAALLAPLDLTDSWLDRVLADDRLRVVVIENGRRQYRLGGITDTWTSACRMALYVACGCLMRVAVVISTPARRGPGRADHR